MKLFRMVLAGTLLLLATTMWAQQDKQAAYQIFRAVNQARAQSGLGPLVWDAALAEAALQHTERMADQGSLSHQYRDEADLAARASATGAHFRKIAENVAFGPSADSLHRQWMHSPHHRANILDPSLNSIGISVIRVGGNLYATEDFSSKVEALSFSGVEGRVSNLLSDRGLSISSSHLADARQACTMDSGSVGSPRPGFIMRWEGSDLSRLPGVLEQRLASRRYHTAAVGACSQGSDQAFTSYRVAVLLY